ATWNDGARLFKYEIDRTKAYQYCENDFVLFRYADVLWMKEEAILRGGAGVSGWTTDPDFATLRARTFAYENNPQAAYAAAYPDALTLPGILDERGREFAWENIRRRDLIRFGKFGDPSYVQYVAATENYRNWFPIPEKVIETSPKDENGNSLWTQNQGYN
ncbi:MAG: RagB/SusD family nutrient uptake outer membrane protein, partial [Rikenellaceae bacterium]|nr:RagB/SusD family nutrient uptake outer membrane protein [Rikenellaceae bacterium]